MKKKIIFVIILVILFLILIGIYNLSNHQNNRTNHDNNQENVSQNEQESQIEENSEEQNTESQENTTNLNENINSATTETGTNTSENTNNDAEKTIVKQVSPSGFMGSSLYRVILYSNGEVYLQTFDGNGYEQENILSQELIARNVTSIKVAEDEELYGGIIIEGGEAINHEIGWIRFLKKD